MSKKICYLFPGQGAQFVGMGKDLYDNYEETRLIFKEIKDVLPDNILSIMFEGSEETLKQTIYTQPAIFLHSIFVLNIIEKREQIRPTFVCGHSVGEYAALVAASVLSIRDAAYLVSNRAKFMDEEARKTEGTMAAVIGLDDEIIIESCRETQGVCIPANFNSPGQVVISGERQAVEKTSQILKDKGAKRVIPLVVSGAWHSPLMKKAEENLKGLIEKVVFKKPECFVVSNVSAEPLDNENILKENLKVQITSSVQWAKSMKNIMNNNVDLFIEMGPGNVLSGLLKRIDKDKKAISISKIEDIKNLGEVL
ncbi:MAG: ACP S-malonyltransferase [Candidatus Hydrogenedentota bacterium]